MKKGLNVVENNKISLKPVKELFGMNFFIPDYQRGYRWGTKQVEDLLRDLEEFYESICEAESSKIIYCLQPLVVMEKDNKYIVIDGQQRLTTVKILLSCLGDNNNYSVEYQTRDKSKDFLDKINEQHGDEWKKNADFFHMYHAKETITEWLKDKDEKFQESFLTIVKDKVEFVWYKSDDTDPIKVFTRLNIGKIGLTESELIKALFLSSNNFGATETTESKLLTLVEIANEWDKIEYRLQDDRFWLFFHGTDYNKPTRIDYILDIAKETNKINKVVSKREESKYRFLPTYQTNEGKKQITKDDNGNKVGIVEKTTQKERVYFFAICKYFETIESFEKDTFIDWMRFCRNVIENAGVYSVAAMVSAMRKIDDFDPKDILTALSEMQIGLAESTKIAKQIQEEIQKAKKIKSENKDWKQQIIEAEDTLFLCGKIGFLFWDDKGQENWDSFKTKLANLKEFFGKDEASIDFVRRYALSFEDFWYVSGRLIFHNKGWQRRGDSWLDVLSEDDLERVHKILMCEEYNNAKGPYKEFVNSKSFEKAVLKEGVFEGKKDLRIAWYNNSYALYKKSAQNDKLCFDYSSDEYPEYLLLRNSLLSKLREVDGFSLGSDQIIVEDESYYYGDDVFLEYNNINYFWSSNDCIYTFDIDKGTKSKKNILEKASKINAYGIIDNLKTYNYS